MQILFKVDQKEALRRGINAPASTVKLEVDPALLRQTEREVLAAVIKDGHDATQNGLGAWTDEYIGTTCNSTLQPITAPLRLKQPDLAGLTEAVTSMLEERGRLKEELGATIKRRQQEMLAAFDALRKEPPREQHTYLDEQANPTYGGGLVSVRYMEKLTYLACSEQLADDAREEYQRWEKETEAENARVRSAAIEAARPELERVLAEREARRQANEEAQRVALAEREQMIQRMPAAFQGRIKAGYATEAEVCAAILALALADAGLSCESFREQRALKTLTDAEFEGLERVRTVIAARLPKAKVDPVEIADAFGKFRKATMDDDPEKIDGDGEVWIEDLNPRRRILVEWSVAGETVRATLPFDTDLGRKVSGE